MNTRTPSPDLVNGNRPALYKGMRPSCHLFGGVGPLDALCRACHSVVMSESSKDEGKTLDPKEQMKAALEAKKQAQHGSAQGAASSGKNAGGPHGQQGGKRTFRRKAGG